MSINKKYNFRLDKTKIKEIDNKLEGEITLAEIKEKGPKITLELIYQKIVGIEKEIVVIKEDIINIKQDIANIKQDILDVKKDVEVKFNELKQDINRINGILERNNIK